MSKFPKILFFVCGPIATASETMKAKLHNALIRNGDQVQPEDKPEPCEGVMGAVIPKQYQIFPKGEDVHAAHREKRMQAAIDAEAAEAAEAAKAKAVVPTPAPVPSEPVKSQPVKSK